MCRVPQAPMYFQYTSRLRALRIRTRAFEGMWSLSP